MCAIVIPQQCAFKWMVEAAIYTQPELQFPFHLLPQEFSPIVDLCNQIGTESSRCFPLYTF